MKIKIISDGTVRGTKVVNIETGEPIEYITAIEWNIDARRDFPITQATITVANMPIEFTGNAALEMIAAAKEIAGIIKEG